MDFSELPTWLPSHLYLLILAAACLSCLGWIYLFFFRGGFWRTDIHLDSSNSGLTPRETEGSDNWPHVRVIIPARNEADILPHTLPGILRQDYPGDYEVVLVNDHSEDGTAETADRIADECGGTSRFHLIDSDQLPDGWTGKLWAMQQGVASGESGDAGPELLLFTDADISHPAESLRNLVNKILADDRDLVSLMVLLNVESFWERLLIPPFVYFFAKLFPFRWVNDPRRKTAAAAGGCMLVRKKALEAAGGLERIHDRVIDDVAMGRLIKSGGETERIWLGLTRGIVSTRPYESLKEIWDMVARTAFTQLRHSFLLLLVTFIGMLVLYVGPLACLVAGVWMLGSSVELALKVGLPSLAASVLMAWSFTPMTRWYRLPILYCLTPPFTGFLYTCMTLDSAWRHWRRSEGQWKGRRYG